MDFECWVFHRLAGVFTRDRRRDLPVAKQQPAAQAAIERDGFYPSGVDHVFTAVLPIQSTRSCD